MTGGWGGVKKLAGGIKDIAVGNMGLIPAGMGLVTGLAPAVGIGKVAYQAYKKAKNSKTNATLNKRRQDRMKFQE